MKNLKKVPTKQLEKFSTIFTQLGLVLVLFVVYISLEHKTSKKTVQHLAHVNSNVYVLLPHEIPVFKREKKTITPTSPVDKVTRLILDEKIEKGDNTIEEKVLIDEPDAPMVLVDPNSIIEVDIPEEDPIENDVAFINIEDAPVFKGCEGLSKKENKRCFDRKMKEFVQRNFDANLGSELGLQAGVHKIQTQFLIDANGNVVDVKIRAPHVRLKKETELLINKLPKFTPGKQRNTPVRVRYTMPIAFKVEY